MTRDDGPFEAIESYASSRADPEPDDYLHWLHDEDGGGDYCGTCIFSVPALPGLVVCSLLWLLDIDIDVASPREHDHDEHRNCRRPCDSWRKVCISVAGEIVEHARDQRDGGWRGESDGPRFCENCSVQLSVCLTGYGAESELDHFEEYGPPEGPNDWYMITEMHCMFAVTQSMPYRTTEEGKRAQGVTFFEDAYFIEERPGGVHSRKPERMREMIELVSYAPRLEMFCRSPREGWSVWGNEVACDVELSTDEKQIGLGL